MPTLIRSVSKSATEASLEQAVANLAYSKLADKVPRLFDYVIGFQLLDQSEDRRRAVGLFGFRVGNRTFRVPIFYRDGQIFGTELLMPNHNTFRPLTEPWVQFLLSREPDLPGSPARRSSGRASGPSLWQLSVPPTKWAAENPELTRELARLRRALPPADAADTPSLLLTAVSASAKLAAAFTAWRHEYPWFDQAVRSNYGDAADQAVRRAPARGAELFDPPSVKAAAALVGDAEADRFRPKLVVIRVTRVSSVSLPPDLTIGERGDLLAGNNVYRDGRSDAEVSTLIRSTPTATMGGVRRHATPGSDGLYELTLPTGGVARCLVAGPPVVPGGGGRDAVVVVRLSDGAARLAHRTRLYARENPVHRAPASAEWREWFESLPKVESPTDLPIGRPVVILTTDARVTVPLTASAATTGFASVDCGCDLPLWEDGFAWASRRHPPDTGTPPWDPSGYNSRHAPDRWVDPRRSARQDPVDLFPRRRPGAAGRLVVGPATAMTTERHGTIVIPSGSRLLAVTESAADFEPIWDRSPPFAFDTDAEKYAACTDPVLTLRRIDGFDVAIDDPRFPGRGLPRTPADAEADLVESHGLRPADARSLVQAVLADTNGGRVEAKIAYALPYAIKAAQSGIDRSVPRSIASLTDEDPAFTLPQPIRATGVPAGSLAETVETVYPGYAEATVESIAGTTEFDPRTPRWADDPIRRLPVPGGDESFSPASASSSSAVGTLYNAARSGESAKDLFDSAALAVLLRHTSLETMVDRLLPKLLHQVDWLGRTLAHLYWNTDMYSERYGRNEIHTLADRIRSLFEGLGDLYLVLNERRASEPAAGVRPVDEINED